MKVTIKQYQPIDISFIFIHLDQLLLYFYIFKYFYITFIAHW